MFAFSDLSFIKYLDYIESKILNFFNVLFFLKFWKILNLKKLSLFKKFLEKNKIINEHCFIDYDKILQVNKFMK